MQNILIIVVSVVLLQFGFLAVQKDKKSVSGRNFFLFVCFMVLWLASNHVSNIANQYVVALWANRLIFPSTTLLIWFLYLFSSVYPNSKYRISKRSIWFGSVVTGIVFLVGCSSFLVDSITMEEGYSSINFGWGIYIYSLHLVGYFIAFIVQLVIKYRKALGLEKLRIQYMLIGIVITGVLTIFTNLFLPVVFGVFSFSNIGAGFTIIFVGMTYYSIIRYRFLGIKVLLGNLLVYALSSVFPLITFYLVLLLENRYLDTPLSKESLSISIFISLIFTVMFVYIYTRIQKKVASTVIHTEYDPFKERDSFNRHVSQKLEIDKVIETIFKGVGGALNVIGQHMIVFDEEGGVKRKDFDIWSKDRELSKREIPRDLLVKELKKGDYDVIVRDEIELKRRKVGELLRWMKRFKITAIVPIVGQKELTGIFLLGERSIPYDSLDIEFLKDIASSANIALERAVYFQEYEELIANLEKKVEERTKQLNELARQQKDIIDVMGHEIRTPLTAIVQELNLQKAVVAPKREAWEKGTLSKEEEEKIIGMIFESCSTIDKASTHAVSLVNDMLETARLDKKRFELNYSTFDLVGAVQKVVDVMKKTTNEKDCDITFKKPSSGKLEVEADENRISEAVYALMSNAIKYGKNKNGEKTKVMVEVKEGGRGKVSISVKDNGEGIAKEDIPKLGKKFVRLNPTTNGKLKRPGGTGLGLFVVKGVVEHHGGKLEIESDGLGKGARFTLLFPRYNKLSRK
ncbi:hypothetical protein JW766_04520 [Candidatus Dojkabacteria bacterium]|nr:hypothetical protein [Candidatus Dojkabacteria bacterium]